MSASVRVVDRGAGKLLANARALARGARVRVGILDDAPKQTDDGEPAELSLLEIAAVHEFGAPSAGIPQRSFVRATVDAKAGEIAKVQRAVAAGVLAGRITPEQGLNQIGAKVASFMVGAINAGLAPPLKEETIARKGSSKPLVDTGQLKSSISWLVG